MLTLTWSGPKSLQLEFYKYGGEEGAFPYRAMLTEKKWVANNIRATR